MSQVLKVSIQGVSGLRVKWHTCKPQLSLAPELSLGARIKDSIGRKRVIMGDQDGSGAVRPSTSSQLLPHGFELDDAFTGLADADGYMTIAGFGSLLSETSARSTFPDLINFRLAKIPGMRRVFAHTCEIFFARGIARPETMEVSSLSVEEDPGSEIWVSLFEVEATRDSIQAFIEREHEFRFVAVQPLNLDGTPSGRSAVICSRWSDEEYRQQRCPPPEWERRYGRHGVTRIWRDDVLPCRVYLRHCVLASQKLGQAAHDNFLDSTYLGDRRTRLRTHLQRDPSIMEEGPPPELVGRYSG